MRFLKDADKHRDRKKDAQIKRLQDQVDKLRAVHEHFADIRSNDSIIAQQHLSSEAAAREAAERKQREAEARAEREGELKKKAHEKLRLQRQFTEASHAKQHPRIAELEEENAALKTQLHSLGEAAPPPRQRQFA